VGSRGTVLHPDDPALRLPVRIADCICTGLRKHSVVSDIAMGFCKRFVPLAVLPLPAAMVLKGYDLIYAGGAHARNSVPQISCRCVPPAGRTLHHVEDVQIRDPLTAKVVGGATKSAALVGGVAAGPTSVAPASRRPPLGGAKSRRWPRRRAKAAARGGLEQTIAVHHRTVERRMTQVERQQNRRVTDAGWTLIEESTNNVSRSRRSRTAHHGSVRRGESHPVSQYRGR